MAAFILTMIVNSNRTGQVTSSTSNMLRCCSIVVYSLSSTHTHTHLTALFWDYPGEPVPER